MSPLELAVRAVIVEDEPQARRNLREYSEGVPWLVLVGEAADGVEAVRLIDELRPDLVFLDVCLAELSGLEVVQRVQHQPDIVFTTAHDRFALAAFEVGALDYLLKPFGRQRFKTMLERVRQRMSRSTVPAAERARTAFGTPLRRLFARTRDGIVPIDVRSIHHLQASGDYVEVFCESGRLSQFHRDDIATLRKGIELYKRHLARAKELEPENPRVLWVEAVPYLVLPADKGGDRARAIELYRRMVEVSGPPVATSPLPDWGKPEGLMSLAYAHMSQPAPDLESAEKEARAALGLQPDWSYVKDVLLPQIEKARAAGR